MAIIKLRSGKYFNLHAPDPRAVTPRDIGHALSNLCRFCGHSSRYYSVAEHSVLTAAIAGECGEGVQVAFACLMHDAAEAYVGDVSSPLKAALFPMYQQIETRIQDAIERKYRIPPAAKAKAHTYDLMALAIEKAIFFPYDRQTWPQLRRVQVPDAIWAKIVPSEWGLPPEPAYDIWMRLFRRLSQLHHATLEK